jgi:hypothetical protein
MLKVVQAVVRPLAQVGSVLFSGATRIYERNGGSNRATQSHTHYGKGIAIRRSSGLRVHFPLFGTVHFRAHVP